MSANFLDTLYLTSSHNTLYGQRYWPLTGHETRRVYDAPLHNGLMAHFGCSRRLM